MSTLLGELTEPMSMSKLFGELIEPPSPRWSIACATPAPIRPPLTRFYVSLSLGFDATPESKHFSLEHRLRYACATPAPIRPLLPLGFDATPKSTKNEIYVVLFGFFTTFLST